jgi:hypothetical protein
LRRLVDTRREVAVEHVGWFGHRGDLLLEHQQIRLGEARPLAQEGALETFELDRAGAEPVAQERRHEARLGRGAVLQQAQERQRHRDVERCTDEEARAVGEERAYGAFDGGALPGIESTPELGEQPQPLGPGRSRILGLGTCGHGGHVAAHELAAQVAGGGGAARQRALGTWQELATAIHEPHVERRDQRIGGRFIHGGAHPLQAIAQPPVEILVGILLERAPA